MSRDHIDDPAEDLAWSARRIAEALGEIAELWRDSKPVADLADSLDAAWTEAEAAVPNEPDWGGPMLYRFQHHAEQGPYGAKASPPGDDDDERAVYGHGPTPAGALRELTAKLRERSR